MRKLGCFSLLVILLQAAVVRASVPLPFEVSYPVQTSTSATVTVGSLNIDPIYLRMQISNLEFEGTYATSTIVTYNGNNTATVSSASGIAAGQLIASASFGYGMQVQAISGTTLTLNQATTSTASETSYFYTLTPMAAISLNGHANINLTQNALVLDPKTIATGGIGGALTTITGVATVPAGQITAGSNTLTLTFLQHDGNASAVRILSFNFYQDTTQGSNACTAAHLASASTAGCTQLVSSDQFTPATYTPPFSDSTNINAGKTAYQTATITNPVPGGGTTSTVAHCNDCHTTDGRDLKYFNYSPLTIQARSQFHGLSSTVGQQIASYIYSLTTPNPGTPWDPLFQPGPGLNESPIDNWDAGVGLQGVLASDDQMLTSVFPTLTTKDFDPNGFLKIPDVPIQYPLLTWNQWLPKVWLGDTLGSTWTSSGSPLLDFQKLMGELVANSPSNYSQHLGDFETMGDDRYNLHTNMETSFTAADGSNVFTAAQAEQLYSLGQWYATKSWELVHTFGLAGEASAVFPSPMTRAWNASQLFGSSPSLSIYPGLTLSAGIFNGQPAAFTYGSFAWYETAVNVNNGYNSYSCQNPIDWNYLYGFASQVNGYFQTSNILFTLYLRHIVQQGMSRTGEPNGCNGYQWTWGGPHNVFGQASPNLLNGNVVPASQMTALYESYAKNLLSVWSGFSPSSWYSYLGVTSSTAPTVGGWYNSDLETLATFWIPRLKYVGVDSGTVDGFIALFEKLFPHTQSGYNWWGLRNATCSNDSGNEGDFLWRCSTDESAPLATAPPFACINGACAALQ
jgi:hypothetical protein